MTFCPDMKKSRAARLAVKQPSARGVSNAGALSARWLAEVCGLPPIDTLPRLASAMLGQEEHAAAVIAHIAWWSRHPDPGGNFERAVRDLSDMPDTSRVAALLARGYDGLLYCQDDTIAGHFFFQRHGAEMHAFAAWADERHRGSKLVATAAMDFLAHAFQSHGVVRARVGTGHAFSDRLLAPLKPACDRLGWRVREGGWIDFTAGDSKRPGAALDGA
jgi:hypothetical protein